MKPAFFKMASRSCWLAVLSLARSSGLRFLNFWMIGGSSGLAGRLAAGPLASITFLM